MRTLLTFVVLLIVDDLALTTNVHSDADRVASCLLGYTVACRETRGGMSNEKQLKAKLIASSRFWGKRGGSISNEKQLKAKLMASSRFWGKRSGGGKATDSVQRELLWSSHQWSLPNNHLRNKDATKYTRKKIAELRQRLALDSTTTTDAPSTTTAAAVADPTTWTDRKRYMLIPYEDTVGVDDQLSVDPKMLLPAGDDDDDRLDDLRRNLAVSSRFWGK